MDRPTCKTCPFWQGSQESQSCHHGPPPWHPAPPWGFCGHHPLFPSYIAAHTYGEMATGGQVTQWKECQDYGAKNHPGSTVTASMKDLAAKGITIEPATQAVEPSRPEAGKPIEPVPRWVDGSPTEDGVWIVQWPRGRLEMIADPVIHYPVYLGVKRSFGPIPPPPLIAAGAAKSPGASNL